jgi:UDP-N-acetylmuramoyl-tripeptide--D-alanyl-D-alanine ligase
MEINELYKIYKQSGSVTTDSRNCPRDAIFFALKGENFNGNDYAVNALENGCSYAIVDEWKEKAHPRVIVVENALITLQKLANYHRKQLKIPIIGIAGSNGKTTTKELVATILTKKFRVIATQENYNNHIGVPLTLLSMNKTHEIGVVEMGAKRLLEIKELCEIVEPDYGLITNIGKDHLEFYNSVENVEKSNCELFDFVREHNGKVFVSKDNAILLERSEGMDRILYGRNDESLFVSGNIAKSNPFLEFTWNFFDHSFYVKTHLVGDYNLDNVLAAAAIGKFFGIQSEQISAALEEYEPKNNRSQFERTERNDLIIDAYNANPTSMSASLDSFSKIDSDLPKAVILGEMKEVGDVSNEEHREIIQYAINQQFEKIYLVGSEFKNLLSGDEAKANIYYFSNVDELCKELKKNPIDRHYILLKGSNSVNLTKCVEWL